MLRFNCLLTLRILFALVVVITTVACDIGAGAKLPGSSSSPSITAVSPKTQELIFSDDFSDSNSGWLLSYAYEDKTKLMAYESGEFLMSIGKDQPKASLVAGNMKTLNLGDFTIEVDVRKASEDNNSACFVSYKDMKTFNGAGYALYLAADSAYYIMYFDPNINQVVPKKNGYLTDVKTGKDTNKLKVTRLGTQTDFYINDHRLESTTDNLSMKSAVNFGIQTLDKNTAGTKYYFDNFKLYGLK